MKLSLLQKHLKKERIDYLFLTHSDPNFTYFTGLKNLSFALLFIPKKSLPLLFLNSLDKEKLSKTAKNILIKEALEKTLKRYLKPGALAYNSPNLTLSFYKKLKKIFPQARFKDLSPFLQKLRAEKTEKEILCLKKAAQLTTLAFHQIVKNLKLKKFKTEKDLQFFLCWFAHQHKAELSFPPIVASGRNTKNPHHQTSDKRLAKGFLLLDFGLSYRNYCSDMTRMLYLGQPSKKELGIYNFLLDVQEQTIKNLKLNLKFSEIEKKARNLLGKYSSYLIHSLGHGVGLEIHEAPSLKPESPDLLKKNQVFTLEPGLYFKNFGLRIEDTVLMRKKAEVLTKARKGLIIIK